MISDGDLERYSRQILLPEIDLHGQQRIDQATVTVVGCGGLGSRGISNVAYLSLVIASGCSCWHPGTQFLDVEILHLGWQTGD